MKIGDVYYEKHTVTGISQRTGEVSETQIEIVDAMPSAEKTGHWETSADRWGEVVTTVNGYRCSECGEFNCYNDNYCPNCGAKMAESEG